MSQQQLESESLSSGHTGPGPGSDSNVLPGKQLFSENYSQLQNVVSLRKTLTDRLKTRQQFEYHIIIYANKILSNKKSVQRRKTERNKGQKQTR